MPLAGAIAAMALATGLPYLCSVMPASAQGASGRLHRATSNGSGYAPRPATRRVSSRQTPAAGSLIGSLFGDISGYLGSNAPARWRNGWSSAYPSHMRSSGRYRTLCVRSCDGYYWPVSFSTTRSGIARDAKACESSCQIPATLYYHPNPGAGAVSGADVSNMVDLQGRPYSSLENAFRYRKEYVSNCSCKPAPWSDAAKQEYKQRAELAKTPEALKRIANAGTAQDPAGKPHDNAAYQASGEQITSPRPRRRARPRYRANDPSIEGRWWAGSW